MTDLPEHLLPSTKFDFSSNSEQNKNGAPSVGLSEQDQKLIEILTNPEHRSALLLLMEERKQDLQPEVSVIPETDPQIEHLVAYLETRYWLANGYPHLADLQAETGIMESQLRQMLVKVSDKLSARGLPVYTLPPGPEDSLFKGWTSKFDPKFVLACNLISSSSDKRSLAAKLAEIDVTPLEWDGWLTNKENYDYFKLLVESRWNQMDEVAKIGIMRGIQLGDLKAIQYYHEFTGKHIQTSQVVVNTSSVIQRVIEVLSAHLSPDMLNTIAGEIQMEKLIDVPSRELES